MCLQQHLNQEESEGRSGSMELAFTSAIIDLWLALGHLQLLTNEQTRKLKDVGKILPPMSLMSVRPLTCVLQSQPGE